MAQVNYVENLRNMHGRCEKKINVRQWHSLNSNQNGGVHEKVVLYVKDRDMVIMISNLQ